MIASTPERPADELEVVHVRSVARLCLGRLIGCRVRGSLQRSLSFSPMVSSSRGSREVVG